MKYKRIYVRFENIDDETEELKVLFADEGPIRPIAAGLYRVTEEKYQKLKNSNVNFE